MPNATLAPVVSLARQKTEAVKDEVRDAISELENATEVLAKTPTEVRVTEEFVEASIQQNVAVETQLHDVVKELEVVTRLLKKAEEGKAAAEHELDVRINADS